MESITRLRWNRRKREVPRASSFPSKRSNRTWTWTTRFSPCLRRNRKQRNPRLENNLLHREFPTICLNKRMPYRYQIAEDNDMNKSIRSEEHTSELQSRLHLVCRLLLEKKKKQLDLISTSDITHSLNPHTHAAHLRRVIAAYLGHYSHSHLCVLTLYLNICVLAPSPLTA